MTGFRTGASFVAWLTAALIVTACASPAQRATRLANRAGMRAMHLPGTTYQHLAFFSDGGQSEDHSEGPGEHQNTRLAVFLEGDGSPWIEDGTRIADDPTPRNPLALRLALRTPGPVLYLGRPCYFEPTAPHCSPRDWTGARYSQEVVASLSAALNGFLNGRAFDSVVLVGHSGGGTLATLMSTRVPRVTEVITIGANLDTAAWARLHGYLPLDESLNPADEPPLPSRIVERHLVGGRDRRVPASTTLRYTSRIDPTSVIGFDEFDHVCCWERDWPEIWSRLTKEQ